MSYTRYLPTQSGNVLSHVCRSLQASSRSVAAVSGNTKLGSQTNFKTCSVLWTKLTCDGVGGSMQPKAVTKQMGNLLRESEVRWEMVSGVAFEWDRNRHARVEVTLLSCLLWPCGIEPHTMYTENACRRTSIAIRRLSEGNYLILSKFLFVVTVIE